MSDTRYYPVDAFYSYRDKKLHYIIKKIENGKSTKMAGFKLDPDIKIKLAKFSKKLQYLQPVESSTKEISIKYSQYSKLKRALEGAFAGKPEQSRIFTNQYPSIMMLEEDIYDDYKIETQFLQQDIFTYDDTYIDNISMAIWDIEVYHNDTEFTNPTESKYPVNAIAVYDLKYDTIKIFFLRNGDHHPDTTELQSKILNKLNTEYTNSYKFDIEIYDTEQALIVGFLKFVQQYDVLVGWNSIDFDTQYIYTRCKRLNISTAFENAFGEFYETMNIVDSKNGIKSMTHYTTKILSLDYVHLIKFYDKENHQSYALNRTAQRLLSKDNVISAKVEIANLNKEYLNDPANFAVYNVGDILLNKFIDDKLLFIKLLFKEKVMTRGFGASTLSINNILDSYIALQCKKEGLMCISSVKVINYYSKKIWAIYRRINLINDNRLELITKLREENKTFSLFSNVAELDDYNYDITEEFTDIELEDETNVRLSKTQIPFIWAPDKYPGAYVKIPTKGIFLNVVDIDAEAMYPTSIYTTNNSADTWVYLIPENVALKYIYERDDIIDYITNTPNFFMEVYDVVGDSFKKFNHMECLTILEAIYKKDLVLTETGAVFLPAHIKEGFFRKLIKYPIAERKRVRAMAKSLTESKGLTATDPEILNLHITQLVLKIIANSCYGYLGFRRSRLFNIILATTITINCQFMLRSVAYNCDTFVKKFVPSKK